MPVQEKEAAAINEIAALMPKLGNTVRVLALKECVYDVEMTVTTLKRFQEQHAEQLKAISKVCVICVYVYAPCSGHMVSCICSICLDLCGACTRTRSAI